MTKRARRTGAGSSVRDSISSEVTWGRIPEAPPPSTASNTAIGERSGVGRVFAQGGIRISHKTVAKLLRDHGDSLQAPNKSVEGAQHPDRNAQFEHINAKAQDCVDRVVPVISVDTKKQELVGNFKNGGREWQPS